MSPTTAGTVEVLRAHLREMPFHRVIIRTIEARILAAVDYPRPILDVGSGDGHFASVVFPDGVDVGLDPGIEEVAESASRGVYRMVTRASSTAMPFADNSFGSVVSNCVFEHIPNVDATVAEIARVLRPGGRFACTVLGHNFRDFLTDGRAWKRLGLSSAHRAYVDWFNRKAIHFHFDSPETWRRRFEDAGLRVESWRYYMSEKATHAFHWSHYTSLPHLVSRGLTRRWVALPGLTDNRFWIRRFLPVVDEPPPAEGSCIAFVCSRAR